MGPSVYPNNGPKQLYLSKYAEPEALIAGNFSWKKSFAHVVVIPAFREGLAFLNGLHKLCVNNKALLILIINQPDTLGHCPENFALWQTLRQPGKVIIHRENLTLLDWQGASVLVVDRFQTGRSLWHKHGVGLARKIGCDIATALINQGVIVSQWIHSTDADTQLPADYFRRTKDVNSSAAVYPFVHVGDDNALAQATLRYQQSLQYYVNGLHWAGSAYAFHTVGSCLAINANHYSQARGFPKRAGGEDFYLLNKLAKLAPVISLSGEAIEISARHSNRVPFGTGPAVEKLLSLNDIDDQCGYDPRVFIELKSLLTALSNCWDHRNNPDDWIATLPSAIRAVCKTMNFDKLLHHLNRQVHNPDDAGRHIQTWFDGFRTLKFIHTLQCHSYPAILLTRALAQAKLLFHPCEEVLP
jgi:hypothetical protein